MEQTTLETIIYEKDGPIARLILKDPALTTLPAIRARMAERGLVVGQPLGFDNAYALAVARATATRLGLRALSDLRGHRELTAAFDPGFLDRDDGWPGRPGVVVKFASHL